MDAATLPNELWLSVVNDFIAPEDVPSFRLTSRLFNALAESRWEGHKDMISRWSDITIASEFDGGDRRFPTAFAILYALQLNPSIGSYVRTLHIEADGTCGYDGPPEFDMTGEELVRAFDEGAVRARCPWIPESVYEAWHQEYNQFHETPAIVMLIASLPALMTVTSECSYPFDDELQDILCHAALRTERIESCPLLNLTSLHLGSSYGENEFKLENIALLIFLPSLKRLSAEMVLDVRPHESFFVPKIMGRRDVSVVEDVLFIDSSITPDNLVLFLEPIKTLKFLRYEALDTVGSSAMTDYVSDAKLTSYKENFAHVASQWLEENKLFAEVEQRNHQLDSLVIRPFKVTHPF